MPTPPELSPEQRAQALAKATEVRNRRAAIKVQLKSGEITFRHVMELADAEDAIAGLKVLSALESLPRIGKVKARRLMEEGGIAISRRLRGLGAHQRAFLERATDN
jgi:hypothetical protein